jgi:RHS repeat-associated protein
MLGNLVLLKGGAMHKDISTMRSMTKFVMFLCLLVVGHSALAQTAGSVTYVYTDPQGTPLAEADASGNITATFDYTPYGTTALGSPPNGPGYTGHVNDPETNLVYMQARYYDPATGHFLSDDPRSLQVGNSYSFNNYAYANNNPILNIDPDGREAACISRGGCGHFNGDLSPRARAVVGVTVTTVDNINDQFVTPLVAADPLIFEEVSLGLEGFSAALQDIAAVDKAAPVANDVVATSDVPAPIKTYQTYTKTNPEAGEVYSGRTSGTGTPEENIAQRDRGHHMNKKGFGPAVLDKSSTNATAIRGREQQLIDMHGGAKSTGGTSGNAINGISNRDPVKRQLFLDSSTAEFSH